MLGIWVTDSEGAKYWMHVLNDLKNRGVDDILIACVDGLKGFPEAINAIFPKTVVQVCLAHQIRNTIKFLPHNTIGRPGHPDRPASKAPKISSRPTGSKSRKAPERAPFALKEFPRHVADTATRAT